MGTGLALSNRYALRPLYLFANKMEGAPTERTRAYILKFGSLPHAINTSKFGRFLRLLPLPLLSPSLKMHIPTVPLALLSAVEGC